MRKLLVSLIACLFVPAIAAAADLPRVSDWTLTDGEGREVTLSEVTADKPVVLMFWATWCPYCKALMPHLQSLRIEHGDDIEILAVSFRDDGDPVGLVRDTGYDFTTIPGGDDVASEYGVTGTPRVYVLDADRQVHLDTKNLRLTLPESFREAGNSKKGAWLAPFWAAEVRMAIDDLLN